MPKYKVDVNYSYHVYEDETVIVTAPDESDIDADMIETTLRKQLGWALPTVTDDDMQIDDFTVKDIS